MPVDNEMYNRYSDTWWDENTALGSIRAQLNPGRLGYFEQVMSEKLRLDPRGKKTLDVGCGGGLLAEEFARLGCDVTGIDPSAGSIETARRHASASGLRIEYAVAAGEHIPFADHSFDIVYCCDVLEHVNDLGQVIGEIARVLKPTGVFLFDTINRTIFSKLSAIKVLQEWPATRVFHERLHDWDQFITPDELRAHLARNGLEMRGIQGLQPRANPLHLVWLLVQYRRGKVTLPELSRHMQFHQSKDTTALYAGYAVPTSPPAMP